jgi:hypothetical protein
MRSRYWVRVSGYEGMTVGTFIAYPLHMRTNPPNSATYGSIGTTICRVNWS